MSGTLIDMQPSKATVRYRPNRTPGVDGCATGPASVSNNAFTGAAPTRRRRSRNALPDTDARPGVEGGEQLVPHLRITHTREKGKCQHEIHAHPRRQRPQPPLGRAGLLQHRIDQLERHLPGQLTQVTGSEHARRHRDRPDHRRQRRTQPRQRRRALAADRAGMTESATAAPR